MKIGITGGIGSGKTIVSKVIQCQGFPVFNSDTTAKRVISSNEIVIQQIIELLGPEAYSNGVYQAKFVASVVFQNNELREALNQIVHPVVRAEFDDFSSRHPVVFNEAAILFETGAYKRFDANILVTAPEELRVKRVCSRDKSSEEEVWNRIRAQWSDERKRVLADYEICNDDVQSVLVQLNQIFKKIQII